MPKSLISFLLFLFFKTGFLLIWEWSFDLRPNLIFSLVSKQQRLLSICKGLIRHSIAKIKGY